MAIHRSYFEHDPSDSVRGDGCGWTGTAQDAPGEMFRELMDFRCPTCVRIGLIVSYPTVTETRAYAAAGNEQAIRELEDLEHRMGEH